MKKYVIVAAILSVLMLMPLMPLNSVHAGTPGWKYWCACTHLYYLGQSQAWSPYDEVAGCSINAYFTGSLYTLENFWFRRNIGYALGPSWASGFLNCYMWMQGGYNDWPYVYQSYSWLYGWLSDGQHGQYYYYQDYTRNGVYFTTNEIYAAGESWYWNPYYGSLWDCIAYCHAPVGAY